MTEEEIRERYRKARNPDYVDPNPEAFSFQFMVNEIQTLLTLLEGEREKVRELEYKESAYQQVIREILLCNPIPASERSDAQLEPPWEVVARIRKELEYERFQAESDRESSRYFQKKFEATELELKQERGEQKRIGEMLQVKVGELAEANEKWGRERENVKELKQAMDFLDEARVFAVRERKRAEGKLRELVEAGKRHEEIIRCEFGHAVTEQDEDLWRALKQVEGERK